MRKLLRFVLMLTLLPAAASLARATLITPLSLEEMTDQAHWIGVGTCTSVSSAWQGKQIWTDAVFKVERSVKGAPSTELHLRQLGGRVSQPVPVAMRVAGVHDFLLGEIDLLFLDQDPGGARRVLGLMQGRIPLRRDASGELRGPDGEKLESILARVEARLKAGAKP